ncbi:MAG: lipoprotein insertase outer membrane protein LolB [Sulfuricaulis sp.]
MRCGLGLLGLAALAAGCATTPALPPVENPAATWQARQIELSPVTTWTIQGRLAVHTDHKGWQASVYWVRDGDRQTIDIIGPLGQGHLRLSQDSHGAELRDADKKTWRADNAEQLLYRTTGWRIPLAGLDYWVLGLPLPGNAGHQELDTQGRLKRLDQSGWDIQFQEYTRNGTLDLPSKIFINRQDIGVDADQAKVNALELRLIIDHWTLNK